MGTWAGRGELKTKTECGRMVVLVSVDINAWELGGVHPFSADTRRDCRGLNGADGGSRAAGGPAGWTGGTAARGVPESYVS